MPTRPTKNQAPTAFESLDSAAQRLALSRKTIRRLVARGELAGYRVAGTRSIRVKCADVEALMARIPTVTTL